MGRPDNHNDHEVSSTKHVSSTNAKLHMRIKPTDTTWVHASNTYTDGVRVMYVNKALEPNEQGGDKSMYGYRRPCL